jgi:hypothetical protein
MDLAYFEAQIVRADIDTKLQLTQAEIDAATFTMYAFHAFLAGELERAALYLGRAEIKRRP